MTSDSARNPFFCVGLTSLRGRATPFCGNSMGFFDASKKGGSRRLICGNFDGFDRWCSGKSKSRNGTDAIPFIFSNFTFSKRKQNVRCSVRMPAGISSMYKCIFN